MNPLIKRISAVIILTVNSILAIAQTPESWSSSRILLELKKLQQVGSVLYIAAHPDDENTRLISYLVNEKCLRTGYLSLTRGDGGQNLIGSEQGVELGLIRTQELLAARRVDGGEQYFTRAYDFGYSKTPAETFDKWNHDSLLADVVWVIRNFKPDVIITRFPTDGRGGHGHHTASAILAEEAFDAAADSTKFPEQLKYVSVWKTRRMYTNGINRFFDPKADMSGYIKLDVGGFNPLLGKSYGEVSAESRSMHKSQGFGSARQRGEILEYFKPIKGDTANYKDIFEGIDFTWNRVNGAKNISKLIDQSISKFDINNPSSIVPILEKIETELITKNLATPYSYKLNQLENIALQASGVFIDLNCSESSVTAGVPTKVTFTAINRSNQKITISKLMLPGVLKNKSEAFIDTLINAELKPNQILSFNTYINPGFTNQSIQFSQPFWLKTMPDGLFHFGSPTQILYPEKAFYTNATVIGYFPANASFTKTVKIQYRWVDPEKGELYRPVVITPPVLLKMDQEVFTFTDVKTKPITVTVKASKDSLSGNLHLNLPSHWNSEPSNQTFIIKKKGEEQSFTFMVTAPDFDAEGDVLAVADIKGTSYSKDMHEIKYDHIPVQTWFPDAKARVIKFSVVKQKQKIGYIPGAGDEVQTCLTQLGYNVVTITDEMLKNGDLNVYETIITGVRAYNTNELLSVKKQKLMEYVKQGGNLLVQYNTNSFAGPMKSDLGPYPFKITRDRVTDENAEITFLLPDHPVLNTPNVINSKDFKGWIQERGIYFAGDIDSSYQCPISFNDKGEKPNKGSLIIAPYGKGNFIYTGLVFFRELPAGVPGAYRLMVNLIEYKR